jgi:hypothetical protein
MTISELGNLGEFVAAIATIATLAYLALQIRQSNHSNQLAAIARIGESTEGWLTQLVQDPTLVELYGRVLRGETDFNYDERLRFNLLVVQLLRAFETGWLHAEKGLVDREYWAGFRATMGVIVGTPAGRQAFASNRHVFNPRFAAEVESLIVEQQGRDTRTDPDTERTDASRQSAHARAAER